MSPPGSDKVIKALLDDGFHARGKSGGGSHQVFRKETPTGARTVVVPLTKKEIPKGTLSSILRQAGPMAGGPDFQRPALVLLPQRRGRDDHPQYPRLDGQRQPRRPRPGRDLPV